MPALTNADLAQLLALAAGVTGQESGLLPQGLGFAPQPQPAPPEPQDTPASPGPIGFERPPETALASAPPPGFLERMGRELGLTDAPGFLERLTGAPSMLHKMQAFQAMQQADPQAMMHDPQAQALGMDIASNFGFEGAIKAQHASPHLFDAVDLGKVGTGQGAQAYGHGFYASTGPGVHQQYLDEFKRTHGAANSYDLTINHDPEDFLAWDKPLSEQSPGVREKLKKSGLMDRLQQGVDQEMISPAPKSLDELTGDDVYGILTSMEPWKGGPRTDQAAASAALREAGIPGLRYLDEGSRNLPDPLTAKDLTIRDQGGGTWLLTSTDPRRGALSPGKIEKQGGRFWARVGQQDSVPFDSLDEAKAYALDAATKDARTHNYVLFSHEPVTIDARNGQPLGFAPAPENVAQSRAVGYNPKPLPERPFSDDYPRGARGDDKGKLQESIEGVKLDAPFVAGRRSVGGGDEGLGEAELREAGSRLVDEIVPRGRRALGSDLGRYTRAVGDDGTPHSAIAYLDSLGPTQVPNVVAHEVGHAVDELAGRIDTGGLTKELSRVYNDLLTGRHGQTRNLTGPQHLGYSADAAPREMMAEAIRAYMVDPNYLKTTAPKTAARIRELVNQNPRIAPVLQFNAVAPVGAIGLGALGAAGGTPMGFAPSNRGTP